VCPVGTASIIELITHPMDKELEDVPELADDAGRPRA
jgi:hypothetical protein